jgi:hypothetical protein
VRDAVSGKLARRLYNIDLVALGVLLLAFGSAAVALMIVWGFVNGNVQGRDAVKIIVACVGGSTISGVVAAMMPKPKRHQVTRVPLRLTHLEIYAVCG